MVLERWTEHFEGVLNEGEEEQPSQVFEPLVREEGETAEPTFAELEKAITILKNNKAPGEDGILSEMIKKGGDRLKKEIFELILMVWREERMPDDWRQDNLSNFKKGDKMIVIIIEAFLCLALYTSCSQIYFCKGSSHMLRRYWAITRGVSGKAEAQLTRFLH
ncbi:uncharacterized protein LOC120351023 [Nilaparvata lugens]|uniref:uncharacterized protein LOC120351023 n=1 Tax=Nilaparvata lugens TaxID=108931 RepID=UPI00193D52D7|nr:uncharacterized protein LOC120351023 [Nilaparvata lugens]